ncbi:AAA domain-containing protein [Actinosynnema sp. CA-248983]
MNRENHPVDDLLRAIQNEKAAVLHSTGASNEHIVRYDGLQVGVDDNEFRYVFSARKWKDHSSRGFLIRPTTSRGQWHPATASAMPDGKVQVTTELDLGRDPRGARLREDDTRELDRLVERLTTLGEHDAAVNRTAADWVLGEGTPRIDRCTDVERFIPGYRNLPLNERQQLAVEHALASDVTFIWGPPGTGKTEVVSRIIQGCLHQGARILFLAPSNIAVDQALERVCVLLQDEPYFDTGLAQRAGDIALTSLREEFGTRISPELLVSQLVATLLEQSARLEEQLARVRENIALHERARLADEELTFTRTRHRELRGEITWLAAAEQEAKNAARTAAEALDRIGTPSGFPGRIPAEQDQGAPAGRKGVLCSSP